MRVLFVLENYLPHIGGVEIVFKNLCEGLAKKGHTVTVITHRLPGTKKEEQLNGVQIIRVESLDSRYLFTFTAIPAVIRHARDADIIHTTTYNGAFPAWIGAAVRGKPKVITVHESWLGHWREYSNFPAITAYTHEFLEWFLYHTTSFDRYLCVSESTRRMLTKALPGRKERIITIHNGFDPRLERVAVPDAAALGRRLKGRFVIFASGRPGTSKGFEYLIEAFPHIKQALPEATLLLMLSKDSQYKHKIDEFKEHLEAARVRKDVIFLEPQPYAKVAAYRDLADCIVVPSISEGFGYAVLEACASGIPVVASDTTSIPEVVYGKHVLVRPKDAQAITDGVIAVSKGKFKNTKKKSFPWAKNIASHEAIYRTLRKGKR